MRLFAPVLKARFWPTQNPEEPSRHLIEKARAVIAAANPTKVADCARARRSAPAPPRCLRGPRREVWTAPGGPRPGAYHRLRVHRRAVDEDANVLAVARQQLRDACHRLGDRHGRQLLDDGLLSLITSRLFVLASVRLPFIKSSVSHCKHPGKRALQAKKN